MDWQRIIMMGAEYIRNNDDESTSGLDISQIASALQGVLGHNGSIDISSLVSKAQESGLMEVVQSWIGNGENAPIEPQKVTELVGSEKVQALAEQLGISPESAQKALADALPNVVDQATNEEPSLAQQLLEQVGGIEGAMNLFKKLF